eukprot:scaffold129607_cov53-Attheya_sp.AAC.2
MQNQECQGELSHDSCHTAVMIRKRSYPYQYIVISGIASRAQKLFCIEVVLCVLFLYHSPMLLSSTSESISVESCEAFRTEILFVIIRK